MEKLTSESLIEIVSNYEGNESDNVARFLSEYANKKDWEGECSEDDSLLGIVNVVQEIGGGEGEGDIVDWVLYFEKYDQYFQLSGWYTSYQGTEWDEEILEVIPYQKTVTFYSVDGKEPIEE